MTDHRPSPPSTATPPASPPAVAALALYTEAEAHAIWARAAELQAAADAPRRPGTETVSGTADAPANDGAASQPFGVVPPAGLYLAHEVVRAAHEAGIDMAHLAVALAEHEAAEREARLVPTDAQRATFRRELGTDEGSVAAVGYVTGTAEQVVAQIRDTFGRAPWRLTFHGRMTGVPGAGTVLRFAVPRWLVGAEGAPGTSNFNQAFVYHANRIGVQYVHVLMTPRETPESGTSVAPLWDVIMTADLRVGQHFNADAMKWMRRALTSVFVVASGAVTTAMTDSPVLSLPVLVGAVGGCIVGLAFTPLLRRIMRWEQRTAMRTLEREFRHMLGSIGQPDPVTGATSPSATGPSSTSVLATPS